MNDGDFVKAEQFTDCGVYEFYYRVKQKNEYIQWHNDNVKKQMEKK